VLLRASGPAEALTDLDTFASRIPAAECTSVFCAVIDPGAATVTYSAAGHPPAILVTADGGYSLLDQTSALPLAVLPAAAPRKQASAPLPPGATLVLYTDGLVERRHISIDDGINAAAEVLTAHATEHPDALADQVTSRMTPAGGFDDDVAVLIYRHPPDPLTVRVSTDTPSCLAVIRARLRQWLPQAGVGAEQGTDILIGIGEATANALEHGTAGRGGRPGPVQITVTARVARTTVQVTVADNGGWRPPREESSTRGRGIPFMHALMDEVTISATGDGTTVTMTKELQL
jgi:anti-sigma regulatory factor (Ser/Thr protein kinase)